MKITPEQTGFCKPICAPDAQPIEFDGFKTPTELNISKMAPKKQIEMKGRK